MFEAEVTYINQCGHMVARVVLVVVLNLILAPACASLEVKPPAAAPAEVSDPAAEFRQRLVAGVTQAISHGLTQRIQQQLSASADPSARQDKTGTRPRVALIDGGGLLKAVLTSKE